MSPSRGELAVYLAIDAAVDGSTEANVLVATGEPTVWLLLPKSYCSSPATRRSSCENKKGDLLNLRIKLWLLSSLFAEIKCFKGAPPWGLLAGSGVDSTWEFH